MFVYEDDDIIIASKPAGIAVDGPDSDTLLRRVQAKLAAEGKADPRRAVPPAGHRHKRAGAAGEEQRGGGVSDRRHQERATLKSGISA